MRPHSQRTVCVEWFTVVLPLFLCVPGKVGHRSQTRRLAPRIREGDGVLSPRERQQWRETQVLQVHPLRTLSSSHFTTQLQLVRGLSIYGYHNSEELFVRITLYSPNDVVPLARQIVSGELARPGRVDKACFPPLLAYEHKYGYKLKFLTDNNIAVLDTVTVTNVVVSIEWRVECSYVPPLMWRASGVVTLCARLRAMR